MNRMQPNPPLLQRRILRFVILILAAITVLVGLWLATDGRMGLNHSTELNAAVSEWKAARYDDSIDQQASEVDEAKLRSPNRQSAQFGTKPVEPAAMLAVLADGKQTVEERVQQLQAMRGIVLSKKELESALAFFAGKQVPADMDRSSMQWLADELMTVLRLQQPPQENLAAELGKVAFQSGTDPVVRDYLMQHLGHLWEQFGAREEIEKSLWLAVASSDETTPGSALIALSRGYQRDQQEKSLDKVRQQALVLVQNPATGLAVRVTALSIAGEGQGTVVKELANNLITDPATPLILRKVAERVVAP